MCPYITSVKVGILYRVEPLLCDDREMGGYIRAVLGQRLGKHVPAATLTQHYKSCVFYVVRAEML
jgi:hypothetical protein